MPRPPHVTVPLTLRVPLEFNKEADEIAELIAPPGATLTRSDAYRGGIIRGFRAIRDDHAPRPADAEKLIGDMLATLPPAQAAGIIAKALDNAALTKLVAALPPAKKGGAPARKPKP